MSLRIGDIGGFAAHTRSLANRDGLIKPAGSWSRPLPGESRRAEPSVPDVLM
jgi:hypothetical protein